VIEKVKVIKGGLMQTLRELRERIKILEAERANLLLEIEKLKKAALERINLLEAETNALREEQNLSKSFWSTSTKRPSTKSKSRQINLKVDLWAFTLRL